MSTYGVRVRLFICWLLWLVLLLLVGCTQVRLCLRKTLLCVNLSTRSWSLHDPSFVTSYLCSLLVTCFILILYSSYPQFHRVFPLGLDDCTHLHHFILIDVRVVIDNERRGNLIGVVACKYVDCFLPHEAGVVVVDMVVIVIVAITGTLV